MALRPSAMRRLLACALLVALARTAVPGDDGVTHKEAWARFDNCRTHRRPGYHDGECVAWSKRVVELAEAGDEDRLWAAYAELPASTWERMPMMQAFLDARLVRALAGLPDTPRPARPITAKDVEDMPAAFRAVPPDYRESLALSWRLGERFRTVFEGARARRSEWEDVEATMTALLRDRLTPAQARRQLIGFGWNGIGCGNGWCWGAERQRDLALLLTLLADGLYEVAACCSVGSKRTTLRSATR